MNDTHCFTFAARRIAGALMLAALAATIAGPARATEIIPSIGVTKSTDAHAGNAQGFGGLALRAPLFPFLDAEGGIAYRQDAYAGDVKVRQWPVTASLWVVPLPAVFAGGGVGWYRTTIDFPANSLIKDSTTEKMGVHLGGGIDLPVAPKLGLELSGRYIFMSKDKSSVDVPTTFNPDFWTVALGLAVKF